MRLKHVHFSSSLSGALIVNLWLSFDYRFDSRLFVHQFGLRVSYGIQDHLSRINVLVIVSGGAISFSMLSNDVTDTLDTLLT